MNTDEKYALNWSSHADHLKQAFDMILEANDFVDVTLSCEGKKIKAHRVILSACSSYFYDLLKDNSCSHPVIVLRDINYDNIKYLLKFMYCGEVQVPTDLFSSFLQTAELLQISGLSGSDCPTNKPESYLNQENILKTENSKLFTTSKSSSTTKRKKSRDDGVLTKKKKGLELQSEEDLSESDSKEDTEVNEASEENALNIQKLLNDNTYLSKDANPECECPVCAEKFISIYILKQHLPYHLGETKCQICGKVTNRIDLLKKHLVMVHKINSNNLKKDK